MGALDRFLNAIKLNDYEDDDDLLDDEEYYDDEDDGFLDDEPKPRRSFLERFSSKKKVDDEEDDYEYDSVDEAEDDYSESDRKPGRTFSFKQKDPSPVREEKTFRSSGAVSKITQMRGRKQSVAGNMEVCVFRPTSMESTREIADSLLDNATVILNLEGLDVDLAQRIFDFTSGACYSLDGTLQKVSSYIFVLGPANVDITGDLQNIIGGVMPSVRAGY